MLPFNQYGDKLFPYDIIFSMKNIIFLILLSIYGHSASLTLNEAKDDSKDFSLLHIKDEKPFLCEVKMRDDFSDIILCTFSKTITPHISKSNRDLFIESIDNKLQISSNAKMILRSLQDDFITTNIIKSDIKERHRHWIVVGYKDELDYFRENSEDGIDFDVIFLDKPLPYVGSLDLNGLPVTQKRDAVGMGRIIKAYKKGQFAKVVLYSDNLLEAKDNTFSQEAKLYKLRAFDKLAWEFGANGKIDTDELIELALDWIEQSPSSKHLPEALMYLAKTYYKLGRVLKGDEYLNILKDAFSDSKFYQSAQIHKADRIYENRKRRDEAIKLYKDALYNTKDISVASIAASKISEKYLDTGKVDKAYNFYKKVVDANLPHVIDNFEESYEFAKQFAAAKKYDLAKQIVELLLGVDNPVYEQDLKKDLAYWCELDGDKETAFALYKNYLSDFKAGRHVEFVQSRLDKVLLDIDEKNITKKMASVDHILKLYKNEPIYKRALLEKAEFLIENREFDKFFELKDELVNHGAEKFLRYGADKKIVQDLQNDNCKEAIQLRDEYEITIKPNLDVKFFECLMRSARYSDALQIVQKHEDEKDLSLKLQWLYLSLHVHSRLDHNKKVILIGEDVEKLSKVLNIHKYDDIVYAKTEAYYNLKEYNGLMLEEVKKAQELFPKSIKNIDLFIKALRYAKHTKEDAIVADYAQKIIELQKVHKISDYSPMVELDLVNALKRLKQYDKALKEDLKLLFVKLNDVQKANVLYLAGELSLETDKPKEAKEFFMKCGEIIEDSAWQRLCAESLKLLDE